MTTTAVFAEILVGGIEALIWVALVALSIGSPSKIDWCQLSKWTTPITPVLLAVAYALGIMVDRVADSFFKRWLHKATNEGELRLKVLARGDKVTDFVEYIRSRLRVSRVTTLNLGLITIAAGFALRIREVASPGQTVVTVVVLAVLTGASFFTTRRIGQTYEKRLREAAALDPLVKKS